MKNKKNLEGWDRQGDNLLMLQPFMDSLIVRGEGSYLVDADGNRILDMAAGQFCSILGHNHKKFGDRLRSQIENGVHLGDQYVSPGMLDCAASLARIAPGDLNKVVLLSTGSEANECAMRMAKVATGRTGMLGFTRGYYGISLATRNLSSISDSPWKTDFQPTLPNQHKILTPFCRHCPVGREYPGCDSACLDISMEMIAQHRDYIAAVIVEPIVSAGGMILPPRAYMQRLYETIHSIGGLFIVDEAQTGFGRCGTWFDIENYGIQPDMLVFSKTGGNGYPAAGIILSEQVAGTLEEKCFTHLSSHQNEPLSAAAVHAVIQIVEEEGLVARSKEAGDYFMSKLNGLKAKHDLIADVRGKGLMIGMELAPGGNGKAEENLAFKIAMLCERNGLHITFSYYEPIIRFIPPLIVSNAEIDEAIDILDSALSQFVQGGVDYDAYGPQNRRSGPFTKKLHGAVSARELLQKVWTNSPQDLVKKIVEKF